MEGTRQCTRGGRLFGARHVHGYDARTCMHAGGRECLLLERKASALFDVQQWVTNFESAVRMALEAQVSSSSLGRLNTGSHVEDSGRIMDVVVTRRP